MTGVGRKKLVYSKLQNPTAELVLMGAEEED